MRGRASVLLLSSLLLFASACARRDPLVVRDAPVVVISVDTLRADRLPAYGYRGIVTPNLDALRKDSILFQNAYSHVPLTLPSHVTLLTGLLPPQNGVRDNYGYRLSEGPETLASFLEKQGYATGGAVSAAVLGRNTGIGRGFGFYDDAVGSGVRAERKGGATARALIRWIDGVAGGPFFAFLHVFEPHTPYEPLEPYRSRYPFPYDGEVARADEIVGDFLDHLRQKGLYDRSLLLFLSDHGEGLGDHGEREHGIFLYREAIRVPLLVKLPGSRRGGETVVTPVGLTDVFPTVARILGFEAPAELAGVSLTEHLPGRPASSRRISSETYYPRLRYGWSDLASLVDERHHYIEAPRPELYDVVADPEEKHNLASGLPLAFRSMRLELAKLSRSFEQPRDSDPEHAKKLVSLGYLTALSPASGEEKLPDPKDRIALLDQAVDFQKLLSEKRDPELIRASENFVSKNPAALDVWRMLADALERRGGREEAIAALKAGLRESSLTAVPALRNLALERLAELLVLAGRNAEALEIADAVLFEGLEALNAVGIAYAEAGRLSEARRSFERALAIDPADKLANFNLATALLRSGEIGAARTRLEEAVRRDPSSPAAWKALGNARSRLGDEAAALEAWRRALELDPSQYDALFNLAIAEGRRGNIADARRQLERFVATAPSSLYARDLQEARRLLKSLGGG